MYKLSITHYRPTWRYFTCRPALARDPWTGLAWSSSDFCILLRLIFLVCTRKPWLAAISHPNPSIVLIHARAKALESTQRSFRTAFSMRLYFNWNNGTFFSDAAVKHPPFRCDPLLSVYTGRSSPQTVWDSSLRQLQRRSLRVNC